MSLGRHALGDPGGPSAGLHKRVPQKSPKPHETIDTFLSAFLGYCLGMPNSRRPSPHPESVYSFQRTVPMETGADDGEEAPTASNGLLTALLSATGTTLVRYSLSPADSAHQEFDLSAWEGSLPVGSVLTEHVLTVEDTADATQMLQEFRAGEWATIEALWTNTGRSLPSLLDRAQAILATSSTSCDSRRRVEYLGMACRDMADTVADRNWRQGEFRNCAHDVILLTSASRMCDPDLLQAAQAAHWSLVAVGDITGLLSAQRADAVASRLLNELNPLQPQRFRTTARRPGGVRSTRHPR